MKSAINDITGQRVTIVSTSGGWTTIINEAGVQSKIRNSKLSCVDILPVAEAEPQDDFEVEKEECDDPDHNDTPDVGNTLDDEGKEGCKVVESAKNRIRHVKDATYNPENMRKLTSSNGNLSYDCGDQLARRLEGKSLQEVYDIASAELGISQADLMKKYEHLNAGMQRMNLGNRIRAAASKAARGHIESLEAKNK